MSSLIRDCDNGNVTVEKGSIFFRFKIQNYYYEGKIFRALFLIEQLLFQRKPTQTPEHISFFLLLIQGSEF